VVKNFSQSRPWAGGCNGAGETADDAAIVPRGLTITCHAWTDGSFRQSAGLRWVIAEDDVGSGPAVAQGSKTLGSKQTAFDVEAEVIAAAVCWYSTSHFRHMVIHSDSTSAIARASHTAAGSGQTQAELVFENRPGTFPRRMVNKIRTGTGGQPSASRESAREPMASAGSVKGARG